MCRETRIPRDMYAGITIPWETRITMTPVALGVGLQKFHMIKVMAADLQKCSEDDLPTAPWRFLLSFFPLPFFFIPLVRCESHLQR